MPIDQADPADPADAPGEPDRPQQPDHTQQPDASPPPPPGPAERTAIRGAYQAMVDRAYADAGNTTAPDTASPRGTVRGADATTSDPWSDALPELRSRWERHTARYPDQERPVPQTHPDGSWTSGEDRRLSPDQNTEVTTGYARIRDIGERDIVPGILAVEAAAPNRHLAGFDKHIKGEDRLKEKVADRIRSMPGLTPTQALGTVADAVRFTFQYGDAEYAAGVREDVARLKERGFTEVERRNTWTSDQYKGINGRWREPESNLLFEVQFHTQASREAKELSHEAYERIRSAVKDPELSELKAYQRNVNSMIPVPPGVADIENYPPGET